VFFLRESCSVSFLINIITPGLADLVVVRARSELDVARDMLRTFVESLHVVFSIRSPMRAVFGICLHPRIRCLCWAAGTPARYRRTCFPTEIMLAYVEGTPVDNVLAYRQCSMLFMFRWQVLM